MKLQVLGTGLARTGTMSLKFALEKLTGEPCYHMVELLKNPSRLPILKEGGKTGQIEWSAFFEGFSASVDYPGSLFLEDMLQLNPNLKVVHTLRDPEEWYESVLKTVYRGVPQGGGDILKLIIRSIRFREFRTRVPVFRYNADLIWNGQFQSRFLDKDFAIQVYLDHEEKVRQTVPPGQLLMFHVADGWEPLCNFLGLPVPGVPFPKSNQRDTFNRNMDKLRDEGVFQHGVI